MHKGDRDNLSKALAISGGTIIVIVFFFAIGLAASSKTTTESKSLSPITNTNEGKYLEITAKGGYYPKDITAEADTNYTLRVKTSATFDCSSALVIPSLNYRTNLPATGITDISIPPQKIGSVIRGTCSMGMYSFSIRFK